MFKTSFSGPNGRTEIELILMSNNIQVNNFQQSFRLLSNDFIKDVETFWCDHRHVEVEGRTKILESFCPQVYGLYAVKLAVAVVLCGGLERVDSTGTKIRGEPHMVRDRTWTLSLDTLKLKHTNFKKLTDLTRPKIMVIFSMSASTWCTFWDVI